MPVVWGNRTLGRVTYVLPDEQLKSIRGLYVSCGITGSRFIECAQLDMIGDVAVLTRSAGRRAQPDVRPLMRRALSSDGQRIGAITDALINERTLAIEALELCRGYLDDAARGRLHIRQFNVQKNGDVIVESSEGGNLP